MRPRKWRIERLLVQYAWTWTAVGPDRVLRYFKTHAEAIDYVAITIARGRQSGSGWFSYLIPEGARPKVQL